MKLNDKGGFLRNGRLVGESEARFMSKPEGKKDTMAYRILKKHNVSGNMEDLNIKFDKLTSHDITYVSIIQTARASGLEKFPVPYVLTNRHNSLCAVGGTINEDDHLFGLTAAQKYGGIYVPRNQAVIHQYAREMLATGEGMILGSDSHTRYGALGTMAMGEGGPELVKQLLGRTYDIKMPEVVLVYLTGEPSPYVGPQDVAIALVGAVFGNGFVKNRVLEFAGPGVKNLSMDFRIGVDVMTTETTCLSSIWVTDDKTEEFYEIHGRKEDFRRLEPEDGAYYDRVIEIDLSEIEPMIALPFHPSNAYTIKELKAAPYDILKECEEKGRKSLEGDVEFTLTDKIKDGKILVDQAVIAGCAGGGFENICAAADIMKGEYIGDGAFGFELYPASTPIYMELLKNGAAKDLLASGAILKPAFCGPCFGAGDTPSNNGFSIRHTTRNLPNREGSKIQNGQIASVALMDARSIAATARNKGVLTGADETGIAPQARQYFFDADIYKNRVFDSKGEADDSVELKMGPNIKDWPAMEELSEDIILKVVSEIHDPVTTTDELIPSGETSSYRSNPLGLAEFTLSRKDPGYVARAREVKAAEDARVNEGKTPDELIPELSKVYDVMFGKGFFVNKLDTMVGSAVFAVKPGDGSAREQAASCQKVLGGQANIALEYATKRYRSNLINWGMLPFIASPEDENSFRLGSYIFIHGIRTAVIEGADEIKAYVIDAETGACEEKILRLGNLTDDERDIIKKGCLINYYRNEEKTLKLFKRSCEIKIQ